MNFKKVFPVFLLCCSYLIFSQSSVDDYKLHEIDDISNSSLTLLPKEADIEPFILNNINEYNPDLIIEIYYETKNIREVTDKLLMELQEAILAASDQKGIEYFSRRRNKMHKLIDDSYFIDDINSKKRVSDPEITKLEEERNFTLYQKDTTFGANYYNLNSRIVNGVIWNQVDNLENLNVYLAFKAVNRNELRISYFIIPVEDKIKLYAMVQIKNPPKVTNILGYEVNILESITRRVKAVIDWYITKI